ncbi:DUF924 family protein [Rhizobium calliandrae]|uniref:DUF924 family protein n=1 Tax=Rhizobium calliandrae TaxID=1312182 RepID=A0ABT7KPT2_9HYPH|nr:DUF924 family protein [Rhizobium calliandrae]MDL2409283.1 DUF924 family protein [Rhizobium calliandrae]
MAASPIVCTPEEVLSFWFEECTNEDWFRSTAALDEEMCRRFRDTHLALAAGVPDHWRTTPERRLAAVIVLDQFARNIYRGTPLAFATDGLALQEAKDAVEVGADRGLPAQWRIFFYLPFEHAEDIAEQDRAVSLFSALGLEEQIDYALRHHAVIAAYGRFPHRNSILGRASTRAEEDYLAQPGAGF